MKIGDEVTVNAEIVDVTASGNIIVALKRGGRFLISPDEVNTVTPKLKRDGKDHRKGK